jgi:hypothetical protein
MTERRAIASLFPDRPVIEGNFGHREVGGVAVARRPPIRMVDAAIRQSAWWSFVPASAYSRLQDPAFIAAVRSIGTIRNALISFPATDSSPGRNPLQISSIEMGDAQSCAPPTA